jgi:predicted Zn-ribbon and HTH transcriptional regulator
MNLRAWRVRRVFDQFPELVDLAPRDQQLVLDRATKLGVRRSAIASFFVVFLAMIPGAIAGFFVASFAAIAAGIIADVMPGLTSQWAVFVVVSVEWVEQRAIRREMRAQLNRAECVKCGYSLAGLTPTDGRVTCPECGLNVAVQVFAWKSAPEARLHPPTA